MFCLNSWGRTELHLQYLYQVFSPAEVTKPSPEMPQWNQEIPLYDMWQRFQRYLWSQTTHKNTYRWDSSFCKIYIKFISFFNNCVHLYSYNTVLKITIRFPSIKLQTFDKIDNSEISLLLFKQVSVHTSAWLAGRRSPSAAHSSHTGAKSTGSTSITPTRSAGTSCTCARIVVTRPLTPDNTSFTWNTSIHKTPSYSSSTTKDSSSFLSPLTTVRR